MAETVISLSAQSGLTANLLGVTSPEWAPWTNSRKKTHLRVAARPDEGWMMDECEAPVVLPSVPTRDGGIGGLAVH